MLKLLKEVLNMANNPLWMQNLGDGSTKWNEFFGGQDWGIGGIPSSVQNAINMQQGTYKPDSSWNSFYQLFPAYHPTNSGYGGQSFLNTFANYRPDTNNPYSLYLSPTASYLDPNSLGMSKQELNSLNNLGLSNNLTNYNTIVQAPSKISVAELLQKHPDAAYWSDDTIQAFADNYKLGLASLYDNSSGYNALYSQNSNLRPIAESSGKVDYTYKGNKYNAVIDPKQIKFDSKYGLVTNKSNLTKAKENSTGLIGGIVDSFGSSPLPTLALLAAAYFGLPTTGVGEAAGTAAGAGAGGALGGAGAEAALGTGMITSPAGLSSLVSAAPIGTTIPAAAGGFLNPALAGGLAGAGAAAGGALSGGLPDFNLPFQSPGSVSTVGESTGLGSVGSTAPDLGTGMITSPEGLSGLINGQPIGTTLGAATPGTTGGYLVPSLGGEALATTAAAGGLASSSSVTDWLGNVFNQGVDKFMSDPLKNTLNLVGGISSYLGNNAQAKALEDYLKQGLSQSDPFGSQRAYYMDRLKNTYTNPEGYLKSPEYSAISKRRLEALERADAAQGRRSQYGARTEKMHEFDLENLTKERTMLAQLAGSGINPSQVSSLLGSLGTGSTQAQANAPGNLLFMLNQIFGGK